MNVNYFHILTLIFVIAKLFEKIDWSWFYVLLPSITSIGIGLIIWIFAIIVIASNGKK